MSQSAVAALAAAIGLASSACALAQPMSKAEYQAARRTVESDFRTARIGCEPMRGNVHDICMADVTAREGTRLAELEAVYSRQDAESIRREAMHSTAREKCEALLAKPRAQCLAAAKRLYDKS
jgi:hypothetical protein